MLKVRLAMCETLVCQDGSVEIAAFAQDEIEEPFKVVRTVEPDAEATTIGCELNERNVGLETSPELFLDPT